MKSGGKVLYIDDDPGVRRLAQRDLQRRGYVVDLAGSGPEGVEKARGGEFDLIAVDHYMPGRDGLETLALLRELPRPPPVVYVTGSEESRVAVAALKAGAYDYVVKTPDNSFFDLLDVAIRQALHQVRLLEEKESAETRLRATNDRLQAMLHEVNHRVANSLQLVSAFVHLQAATVADDAARAALESTKQRIAAIAQVHRRLLQLRRRRAGRHARLSRRSGGGTGADLVDAVLAAARTGGRRPGEARRPTAPCRSGSSSPSW